MLYTVAQLCQNRIRNITGALCHKINANTFGTDQFYHLFHLLHQRFGRIGEQHMGFIKEKYQFGFIHIPFFGQGFKQFRQHPQQETGIQFGILHQLHAVQNIYHTLAVFITAHPVCHIQSRFPEEQIAALIFQRQQRAGDTAQGLGRDIAVFYGKFLLMLIHIADHGSQVFQIDQFQTFIIGNTEQDIHDPFLCRCQVKDSGQKIGTHIGNGDTNGMASLLINIPEGNGIAFICKRISDTEFIDPFFHAVILLAGGTQTGNIALGITEENRHPCIGEGFCHHFHGNGFTGTASTCHQTVTVCHIQRQDNSAFICQTQINIVI